MEPEIVRQFNGKKRYNDYGSFIRGHFGERVQKISLDTGFTCPNRDGTKGIGGCSYCNNNSFNPDYVKTVFEAMPNSQTSVVQRAGWSEFALRIVDVIQAIYGGETPDAAAAAGQADFKKMIAK